MFYGKTPRQGARSRAPLVRPGCGMRANPRVAGTTPERFRRWRWRALLLVMVAAAGDAPLVAQSPPPVRIKDVATVAGTGGQKVMGYGLVVGLEGTGDSARSILTARSLGNMLEHFDLKVLPGDLSTKNVAAVIVTASLPATARQGDTVDVTLASVGDATSIYGGVLLPTPLRGNDNQVYMLAQGCVSIGGMNTSAGGEKVQKNHPLTGRIPAGGLVMQDMPPALAAECLYLTLRQPDFTTAFRIAEAISKMPDKPTARAVAAESVEVRVPPERRADVVGFIAQMESLPVVSDVAARVVVNERTGTVIIGGEVRILPVAIAHGSLKVTVSRKVEVSQPPPFSGGTTVLGGAGPTPPPAPPGAADPGSTVESAPRRGPTVPELPGARTVVVPKTQLKAEEEDTRLMELQSQTQLSDLIAALNALGVKPRDLIAILQALRAANALQAELVVM